MKVYMDREINEFNSSTTTTEVGMGALGDQAIAYEAAEEWADIYRPDRFERLQRRRVELESTFMTNISNRTKLEEPNLGVIYDNNE